MAPPATPTARLFSENLAIDWQITRTRALLLRDRHHESRIVQGRAAAELLDALAGIILDSCS